MRGSSSLATFLLMIPLAVIPLLAIFGIPQFVPGISAHSEPQGDPFAELADPAEGGDAPAFGEAPAWDELSSAAESGAGSPGPSPKGDRPLRGGHSSLANENFANGSSSTSPGTLDQGSRSQNDFGANSFASNETSEFEEGAPRQAPPWPGNVVGEAGSPRGDSINQSPAPATLPADFGSAAPIPTLAGSPLGRSRSEAVLPTSHSAPWAGGGTPDARVLDVADTATSPFDESPFASSQTDPSGVRTADVGGVRGYQRESRSGMTAATSAGLMGESLTWQAAVTRLNELQIRSFRLEPGEQLGQFIFTCSYTPDDNARLSYRFEAEANEPLKAVEKVLEQIDEWMASRRQT